jgi:hypothetical protein
MRWAGMYALHEKDEGWPKDDRHVAFIYDRHAVIHAISHQNTPLLYLKHCAANTYDIAGLSSYGYI